MNEPSVFLSYNMKDKTRKDRLLTHLKALQENGVPFEIWDDEWASPGAILEEEIKQAISQAQIAILLVSADYLASSNFINIQKPILLQRYKNEGLEIFPVLARYCTWETALDWLDEEKIRPKNKQPVWRHGRDADKELTAIAKEVAHPVGKSNLISLSNTGSDPFKKTQNVKLVSLVIKIEDQNSEFDIEGLHHRLSDLAGCPSYLIVITSIRKGSIILELQMSLGIAEKLLTLYEAKDPRMHILGIRSIQILDDSHKIRPVINNPTPLNAGDFTPFTNSGDIEKVFTSFEEQMKTSSRSYSNKTISWRSGTYFSPVYWRPDLRIWSSFDRASDHYISYFGVDDPREKDRLEIRSSINLSYEGTGQQKGIFLQRYLIENSPIYLARSSHIGGTPKGVDKSVFLHFYKGDKRTVRWMDGKEDTMVIIGEVGDEDLPAKVASFVHQVETFKALLKEPNDQKVFIPYTEGVANIISWKPLPDESDERDNLQTNTIGRQDLIEGLVQGMNNVVSQLGEAWESFARLAVDNASRTIRLTQNMLETLHRNENFRSAIEKFTEARNEYATEFTKTIMYENSFDQFFERQRKLFENYGLPTPDILVDEAYTLLKKVRTGEAPNLSIYTAVENLIGAMTYLRSHLDNRSPEEKDEISRILSQIIQGLGWAVTALGNLNPYSNNLRSTVYATLAAHIASGIFTSAINDALVFTGDVAS